MHLDARNQSLVAKENEIQKLQGQNQKLNNFRYVLDHRIKQLLTEKGPMSAHVEALEKHIQEMYKEFVTKFNEEQVITQEIQQKDMKLNSLSNEVKNLRQLVIEKDRRGEGLIQAITRLVKEVDPNSLQDELKKVYRIYIRHERAALLESTAKAKEDTDLLLPPAGQEIARHRDALLVNLNGMGKRMEASEMRSKQFSAAKMNENSLLINECNRLRKAVAEKNRKISELQERLGEYDHDGTQVLPKISRGVTPASSITNLKRSISPPTVGLKKSKTTAVLNRDIYLEPENYDELRPNASTGEIRKGTNKSYHLLSESYKRVNELMSQVESNDTEIMNQQCEISQLRQQVQLLSAEANRSRKASANSGEFPPLTPNY